MRVRKGIAMRELIPSKDVREYMEKKGKKLTDFERATLAYNYPDISIGERLEMLKEIMDTTQDQKLEGQIRYVTDFELAALANILNVSVDWLLGRDE